MKCVVAARLEPGDVDENRGGAQARRRASRGRICAARAPFTGRVNLFAERAGLAVIGAEAIDRVNAIDEAITVATLPRYRVVADGDMVATVKIIPFATRRRDARGCARRGSNWRDRRSALQADADRGGLDDAPRPQALDRGEDLACARGAPRRRRDRGSSAQEIVPHEIGPLAKGLARLIDGSDALIAFGASAITDRRDVIPAAIEAIGGRIERFGMPVDPGNLLLLAERHGTPIIGAPGCARSPKENGFDWVLQRVLAGVPIHDADIRAMGVGGLLMEIASRPQPRAPDD